MGLGDIQSDLAASNTLKVPVTLITNAQAWKRQIQGTYNLIYTYAQADFIHLKDFDVFLKTVYTLHTHGNGNNGSPTTPVIEPATLNNSLAQALLQPSPAVGKMRVGISDSLLLTQQIDTINSQDLG